MNGIVALKKAKKYTEDTADSLGSLKGAPAEIESITPSDDGTYTTIKFSWNGNSGTKQTDELIVYNGKDGVGIKSIEVVGTGDTRTFIATMTNGTKQNVNIPVIKGDKGDKGDQGIQGIQGLKGDKGEQGEQGIQGIKGDKGDNGYPFLIYKEYTDLSEFNKDDFPEIGLMFMIKSENATNFPVYRYTGDDDAPYSHITDLSTKEAIKGEKGDKGDQGIQGKDGKDGKTYTPVVGTVSSGNTPLVNISLNEDKSTMSFDFTFPKGDKGEKGDDGISPTAKVEKKDKTTKITITDKNGSTSAEIKDPDTYTIKEIDDKFNSENALLKDNATKNLFKLTAEAKTIDGFEFTINKDNSVVVSGASTKRVSYFLGRYTAIGEKCILTGTPKNIENICIQFVNSDNTINLNDFGDGVEIGEDVIGDFDLYIILSNVTLSESITFYPMIRKAAILNSDYEINYRTQKQLDTDLSVVEDKTELLGSEIESVSDNIENQLSEIKSNIIDNACVNLLEITAETTIVNGVTITVNRDQNLQMTSIVASGTATSNISLAIGSLLVKDECYFSGINNGSGSTYFIRIGCDSSYYGILTDGEITLSRSGTYDFTLTIMSGYNADNLTFYPMVSRASGAKFEPHYFTVKELSQSVLDLYSKNLDIKSDISYLKTNKLDITGVANSARKLSKSLSFRIGNYVTAGWEGDTDINMSLDDIGAFSKTSGEELQTQVDTFEKREVSGNYLAGSTTALSSKTIKKLFVSTLVTKAAITAGTTIDIRNLASSAVDDFYQILGASYVGYQTGGGAGGAVTASNQKFIVGTHYIDANNYAYFRGCGIYSSHPVNSFVIKNTNLSDASSISNYYLFFEIYYVAK